MPKARKGPALRKVMNQIRGLFHKFAQAGTRIHQTDNIAIGKRAVLEDLLVSGPQTIPQMARKRPVSRQHILNLVQPLKEGGDVEFIENPEHKRSFLVVLTDQGREKIQAMLQTEEVVLEKLAQSLKMKDLETTIASLSAIKNLLESEKFITAVEEANESNE
jgi:DNA-binding MarR family transcriptional regulator